MGLRLEDKIVIVTRPTRMDELVKLHATPGRAKFHLERARDIEAIRAPAAMLAKRDVDMELMELGRESDEYDDTIETLRRELDLGLKVQVIDRDFLPNFVFGPRDVVVPVGQDGLVANAAKYVGSLPIVAVNPDPDRIDGILLPFDVNGARRAVRGVLDGRARFRQVTMAEATLSDGQRLLAFNDFFIGSRTHVSARYRIEAAGRSEPHSSSGVIVSTGAGSTGWLSSVFNMAGAVARAFGDSDGARAGAPLRLEWEDPRLVYVVREPFVSKQSAATVVAGVLEAGEELIVESMMSQGGVIFSDGIESDYLEFTSGSIAHLRTAPQRARLVVG